MTTVFPEMVDAMGEKPNGERVSVGKVPMPEKMKAKDFIATYFGYDFEDEDSDASMALYAFEEFLVWQEQQRKAVSELIYKKEL